MNDTLEKTAFPFKISDVDTAMCLVDLKTHACTFQDYLFNRWQGVRPLTPPNNINQYLPTDGKANLADDTRNHFYDAELQHLAEHIDTTLSRPFLVLGGTSTRFGTQKVHTELFIEIGNSVVREQERPQAQCLAQDRIIILTAQDGRYPLPSPVLIDAHYSIARISHATGCGEIVRQILRIYDALPTLARDGTTNVARLLLITTLGPFARSKLGDDNENVGSGAVDARPIGRGLWRKMIVEQPFDVLLLRIYGVYQQEVSA
ncbi:hypothetical protein P168DRAFT_280183 [Aspergillus campestris IBT 28561]|uniref:Uncharacterized protein n=1 Tax=Aspergillus campestris (strain IBT 28561) TaxID=1392248 RepID=A0A2I1DAB7_ASPC2|nr:uncharacterized protein P168DRAFT_280183 [Aspergillus campestris IBT 28561]PKY06806.1 hypothetical protein P168DRAFT_280183 [Aspergillus campestris IBT 28561]